MPAQDTAAAPASTALSGAGQAVSGFFNNMGTSIGKMFGSGTADSGSQATQTAEERARSQRHSIPEAVLAETAVIDFLRT